jgi:hypothetical protein
MAKHVNVKNVVKAFKFAGKLAYRVTAKDYVDFIRDLKSGKLKRDIKNFLKTAKNAKKIVQRKIMGAVNREINKAKRRSEYCRRHYRKVARDVAYKCAKRFMKRNAKYFIKKLFKYVLNKMKRNPVKCIRF